MRRSLTSRTRGLSLVELVIAVLILSIAVIGTYRVLDQSSRQIGTETARLLAGVVAANRAEELRLARTAGYGALPGQVRMGPHMFEVEVSQSLTAAGLSEATIKVRAAQGPQVVLVTYLPAAGGS